MKFIEGMLFGMGMLLGILIMAIIINFLSAIGLVDWLADFFSDLGTKIKEIIDK